MLETLTSDHFAPYLDETFFVHADTAAPIALQLTQITPLGAAAILEAERCAFSLIFRGPRETVLPQRIYRLAHDRLGELDIFLVPIGANQEGIQYEALFT